MDCTLRIGMTAVVNPKSTAFRDQRTKRSWRADVEISRPPLAEDAPDAELTRGVKQERRQTNRVPPVGSAVLTMESPLTLKKP